MVFDDDTYLVNNPMFRAESFGYPFHFNEFVNTPGKLGLDPDLAVNFVTRPVAYATFYFNYILGGWDTRGMRLFNILIHAGNAILLWAVLRQLVTRLVARGSLSTASAAFIPAAAAVLFVAHPLAVESVTYIVQRFTSLAAFWSLLAAWLYFCSTEEGMENRRVTRFRIAAGLVMLLGMLTKECCVVIPLLILMVEMLVLGTHWRPALRRTLPLLVSLPVIPVLILMASAALNGGIFDLGSGLNIVNSRDEPVTHFQYLITQFTVVAHYLRLMVWPAGLNIDPTWEVRHSFFEGQVLASFLLHAAIVAGAAFGYRTMRHVDARARLVLAFVLWFYGSISISSGLVPLPDMVAEHRSYVPSIGMFVVFACLFDVVRGLLANRPREALAVAAIVTAAFSSATIFRNRVWSGADSLWADAAKKSPGKFRVWSNLGVALSAKGREREAADCYRKSVEIEPAFANGVLNLSNSLLRLNRPKEALTEIDRLREHNPEAFERAPILYTKALGLLQTGKAQDATSLLRSLVEKEPRDFMSHRLLGIIFSDAGKTADAERHLRRALALEPNDAPTRQALEKIGIAVSRGS
jgi:tetratricopeptide (TPR) repeat protein